MGVFSPIVFANVAVHCSVFRYLVNLPRYAALYTVMGDLNRSYSEDSIDR